MQLVMNDRWEYIETGLQLFSDTVTYDEPQEAKQAAEEVTQAVRSTSTKQFLEYRESTKLPKDSILCTLHFFSQCIPKSQPKSQQRMELMLLFTSSKLLELILYKNVLR